MDEISKEIPNEQLKDALKKLKSQLEEERQDLDHKAEKSLDKACEICSQSAGNIKNVVARLENTLDEIYPDWKNIPQLGQIFDQIDSTLSEINRFCPFEYKFYDLAKLRSSERFCFSLKEHCGGIGAIIKKWNEDLRSIEETLGMSGTRVFRAQSATITLLEPPTEEDNLCFNCNDFVNMAENLINQVEGFLSKVLPEWESLPLMPELDNMIHSLLDDLHKKCSKSGALEKLQKYRLLNKSSYKCLNHDESAKLNGLLKYVDQGFVTFSSQLKQLEEEISNEQVKQMLESVKSNVDNIQNTLNDQIVDRAETLCLDCQQISQAIKNVIKEIKDELDEYYPEWKKNQFIASMVDQLDEAWKLFNDYCPVTGSEIMTFDLVNVALDVDTLEFVPVTPCVLYMAKKGCLDEHEKEKLLNITKEIHLGLDMAANMIKLRADFEPNPVKKLSLLTGAKVVKAIGDDIVTNLTRLADEFCGDCQDITVAVRDSMMVLEEALFDVEPIWKKTPIYSGVKQITDDVFEELKTFCDRSFKVNLKLVSNDVKEECLTPEEKDKLKYYVDQADGLLTYAAETLQTYADELADGPMKEQLEEMAKAVKAVDHDLIQNFTKIADEACGSCLDVVKALKDLKNSVEAAMSDVDPDWRSDSQYNAVALAVETFISVMEELCPAAKQALLEENRCELSESEVDFMKSVAKAQEMALKFRVKLLGTSKFVEKQQKKLLRIQHEQCPKRSDFFGITIENSLNNVVLNEQGWTPKSLPVDEACSGKAEFLYGSIISSLSEFSLTLSEAMRFEGAKDHHRQMSILRDMMELAKEEVDRVIQEASNPCSICGEVSRTLSDALYEVKEMIEEMIPVVAKNPIFEAVIDGLESVLKLIHDYCPQESSVDDFIMTVME